VHYTKISPELKFGSQASHPKMWHFAESLCKSKQTDMGVSVC